MEQREELNKKSDVKVTRQKRGTVVSVSEFLSLTKPKGDLILQVGREQVAVTSLDRIYWPDEKLTKFDLLCFYLKVADYIMDSESLLGTLVRRERISGSLEIQTRRSSTLLSRQCVHTRLSLQVVRSLQMCRCSTSRSAKARGTPATMRFG